MQKITPFLWFDDRIEEAVEFYAALFPNAEITSSSPGPDGKPFMMTFNLEGQEFMALNGGPRFKFTEAFSLFVRCKDQAEVDYYWDKLTADGGEESMCGWLKDKFGLSWQIIPDALMSYIGDANPAKAQAAMQAMLRMHKIDIAGLERARAAA